MADNNEYKPLRKISEAFNSLATTIKTPNVDIEVAPFSQACSHVSPLFGCLGIAFKFAEIDYVAKVIDLSEASKSIATLQSLIERDMEQNCVRKAGSHTRNLLRVKRGLDMVRVLFEQMIATEYGFLNPTLYEHVDLICDCLFYDLGKNVFFIVVMMNLE
ncbi:hypothetical protein GIB67_023826 [Kingdonia uniflora]|uniref:Glycolipid transfer protein domain-containing protein n=1 Tax=Kingdonia uniflora TaxID=39325 RepID=A0A7J7NG00_9MAGN|nr:hypothetical protein GIB67_023826 [Kingdonia uniflora]